jgi:hypothetical protein
VVFGDQKFERGFITFLHTLDQHLVDFFFTHLGNIRLGFGLLRGGLL